MNKSTRYTLYTLGTVAVLVAGGMTYIAASFTPETVKPMLADFVKTKTGRTLEINGEISLSVFPQPTINLSQLNLSDKQGQNSFASIGSARASLQFWPLLSRQFIFDSLELDGLTVRIAKDKQGKFNFEDLIRKDASGSEQSSSEQPIAKQGNDSATSSPLQINLSQFDITRSQIEFDDQQNNQQWTLKDIGLFGRSLTLNGTGKIDFSTKIQGTSLPGEWAATVNIDKVINQDSDKTWVLDNPMFTLDGKQKEQIVKVKALFPNIYVNSQHVTANQGDIATNIQREGQTIDTGLKIKDLDISPQLLGMKSFLLDVKANLKTHLIKSTIASSLNYDFRGEQFLLPALKVQGDVLNNRTKVSVPFDLTGRLNANSVKGSIQGNFTGAIDQKKLSFTTSISNLKQTPSTKLDVKIDRLDLNPYLSGTEAKDGSSPSTVVSGDNSAIESPIDLSGLDGVNADVTLSVGSLLYQKTELTAFAAKIIAGQGVIKVSPMRMNAFGGEINLSGTATTKKSPSFTLHPNISGVEMYPLLQQFADFDKIEGKGMIKGSLTFSGTTKRSWLETLGGNLAINVNDGAWRGVNIAKTLREMKSTLKSLKGGEQTVASSNVEKTDFTELSATLQINKGIAHNQDLTMKSPLLRIAGEGDISFPASQINYLLNTSVVNSSKGQTGKDRDDLTGITIPLRIKGSLSKPAYSIDVTQLIKLNASKKIDEKKEVLQNKLNEKLGDKVGSALGGELKKLF